MATSPGKLRALAFNGDHSLLASADAGFNVCLWDLTTFKKLLTWQGHEAEVTALAWHPDGKSLVSAAKDGSLKLWNVEALRRDLKTIGLGP